MKFQAFTKCLGAAAAVVLCVGVASAEPPDRPWYFQVGGGWYGVEKDESYLGHQNYQMRLGYMFDPQWSIEAEAGILPLVKKRNYDQPTDKFQMSDDTMGVVLGGDLLYHFSDCAWNEGCWNPYLAAGGGVHFYGRDVEEDGRNKWFVDAGFGTFYYWGQDLAWYLRPDYRLMVVGDDGQINHLALLSVGYRWGAVTREVQARTEETGAVQAAGRVLSTVYFAFDSARLSNEAQDTLRRNAEWLNANPNEQVTIEGYCDERGTNEYNLALGQRRADSVFNYLKSLGVSPERLRTISYGEEYPADPGHNEAAWAKNRRAEFKFDGQRAVPVQ